MVATSGSPALSAERGEAGEAARIVAAIEMVRGEIGAAGEIRRDPRPATISAAVGGLGWQHDDDLPLAVRDHIGVVEMAFALGRAALAEGQQPRQPAIGGAILGIGEQARAVAQIEAAPDDEADARPPLPPDARARCRRGCCGR